MSDRVKEAMRQWSAETAAAGPPPEIEQAVLAAFDRSAKSTRRVRWVATLGAIAAALTVVIWSGPQQPAGVPESSVMPGEFVALPYVIQPAQYERIEVVRMSVPVSELMAAGLSVNADPGSQVQADFVVGQDGRARAVRLVENLE